MVQVKPVECVSERLVRDGEHLKLQDLEEASWQVMPNPVFRERIDHARTANGHRRECWTTKVASCILELGLAHFVDWPAGWYAVRAMHDHGIENRALGGALSAFSRTQTFQGGTERPALFLGHGIGQCVDKMGASNGAAARCAFGIADGGLDVCWIHFGGSNRREVVSQNVYGRVRSRPNALAPHSLSLERHRAVWAFMQQRTSFFKAPLSMLHLAPE